jgi:VanZ family protein
VLAGLAWPSYSWRDWTALAFLGAVCVEVTQAVLLSGRQATFSDVVANTAGALVGAVLIQMVRPMLRTKA